jgi:hypothetical protein
MLLITVQNQQFLKRPWLFTTYTAIGGGIANLLRRTTDSSTGSYRYRHRSRRCYQCVVLHVLEEDPSGPETLRLIGC